MTSDAIDMLRNLPHPDLWTGVVIVLLATLARALVRLAGAEDRQCPAHRAGYQCVHLEGHPGSHRDEFGDYWHE